MAQKFDVAKLPAVDQQAIKTGRCPWCLVRLVDNPVSGCDECPACGDLFTGKLTIED